MAADSFKVMSQKRNRFHKLLQAFKVARDVGWKGFIPVLNDFIKNVVRNSAKHTNNASVELTAKNSEIFVSML